MKSQVAGNTPLEELDEIQLAAVYQELTGRSSRGITGNLQGIIRELMEKENPLPEKNQRRQKKFNYPLRKVRRIRPGCMRSRLADLLEVGATFEECQQFFGWDYKTCYEQIYRLHYFNGYGLREDEDGKIRLVI